jgi:hypothetical protein
LIQFFEPIGTVLAQQELAAMTKAIDKMIFMGAPVGGHFIKFRHKFA